MTKREATKRLANRWLEQVDLFPAMRDKIPLALYISRNIAAVRRNDLLKEYAQA